MTEMFPLDSSKFPCENSVPNNCAMPLLITGEDSAALAVMAAANVPVLSDDMYNIIRAIVPPPPSVGIPSGHGGCYRVVPPEELFSRRPSEKELLQKVKNPPSCEAEAKKFLEELYIQLIEPKRYTAADQVEKIVMQTKNCWPKDKAVQEQALNCLFCLSQLATDFCLSSTTAMSVLETMKSFPRDEKILRLGVKLLTNHSQLHSRGKLDLANLLFNSLCDVPGLDGLMLFIKNIVKELELHLRTYIREQKCFVEMLLDFPNRFNNQITVFLCWCALDTLALLAECSGMWNALKNCEGEAKLQRLSRRPELEDRCKMLLTKIFPSSCKEITFCNAAASAFVEPSDKALRKQDSMVQIQNPCPQSREPLLVLQRPRKIICALRPKTRTESSQVQDAAEVLPVDELITRNPPTPPPTVADNEDFDAGRFSDDELFTPSSPFFPYHSPTHETSVTLAKEFGYQLSPASSIESSIWTSKENFSSIGSPIDEHLCKFGDDQRQRTLSSGKLGTATHCIFCDEPKGKQTLLMKQLRQVSHCLQKPCNLLLFNCIESNLCEKHKV